MRAPLHSLEVALFRFAVALALVVAVLANVRAHAAERWTRATVVHAVEVRVIQATEAELDALRVKHSPRRPDGARMRDRCIDSCFGFSLLYRSKSGAFRCEVYMRDTADAATLEHELRHCNGWVHQ